MPLTVRTRCLSSLFATLGPVLANLVSYWRMYLLKCKVNLRSTVSVISYFFSQLIRLTSLAGYFDCQYQIFKLKSETAPLLYHCTNGKNLHKPQQCICRNEDEGIIELLRQNLASCFDAWVEIRLNSFFALYLAETTDRTGFLHYNLSESSNTRSCLLSKTVALLFVLLCASLYLNALQCPDGTQ